MSTTSNAYIVVTSLDAKQRAVLQAIYDYFHAHAKWPKFITIDRPLRRAHKWNIAAIVQSLPEAVIVPPRQGLQPGASDELRLRLVGIEACEGGSEDAARFARLLHWLAEREESYDPEPGGDEEMPLLTSQEAASYLGLTGEKDRLSLLRLFAMLQIDHWGLSSTSATGDSWQVRLGQDIWRFSNVQTVQDIIDAREAWIAEGRRPLIGADYDAGQPGYYAPATGPFVQPSLPPAAPPYINHLVIDAICAKDGQSAFNVTKLLKLIDELNDNYSRENTYASHALLRGLLDHIPPILGCKSFDEVANNYHWSKTDKNYMKHLANFRTQGDDALHRQISADADLLGFDDMPPSVSVDHLLLECARKL